MSYILSLGPFSFLSKYLFVYAAPKVLDVDGNIEIDTRKTLKSFLKGEKFEPFSTD
jgi:hypothetical protein